MKKNMYSLILMEDVVRAVDWLAHEHGTSRSGMVNRILAKELSVMTPQICVTNIFEEVKRVLAVSGELQIVAQTPALLVVRGVLPYRYNPNITYKVELRDATVDGFCGELRVNSRSQCGDLLAKLAVFFELWSQLETTCLGERFPDVNVQHLVSDGRLQRSLQALPTHSGVGCAVMGGELGRYLLFFHRALHFSLTAEYGVDVETFETMVELYRDFLDTAEVLV